jgi:hypothetical protein
MGILDPSESDKDPGKKPRFLQDISVVIVVALGVVAFFIVKWIWKW